MEQHIESEHNTKLHELCRTCGGRSLTSKQRKQNRKFLNCADFINDILLTFGVHISGDQKSKHSSTVCYSCVNKIKAVRRHKYEGTILKARELERDSAYLWTSFSADTKQSECPVCTQYAKTTFGGYASNQVPFKVTHTEDTDTSDYILNTRVTNILSDSTDNTLTEPPTELFSSTNGNTQLSTENSSKHMSLFPQFIEMQDIQDCSEPVPLSAASSSSAGYEDELPDPPIATSTPTKPSKIMTDSMTSPAFKQDKLFSHSLEISPTRPLTIEEQKLNTHFVRRQLNNSKSSIIECKTGGQPILMAKVIKARKESAQAKTRTKRAQTHLLSANRAAVAGTSKESLIAQHASELKHVELGSRRDICESAGIKSKPPQLSNLSLLAMKEATDLTWSQLRQQRSFLKQAGLSLQNEHKQRAALENLNTGNIVTQMVDFVDSLGHTHHTALARVSNISDFIIRLLDQHKKYHTLTWHESVIPEDEIWVKLGGDHGKDSLKFTMQIANTYKPN